MAQSLAQQRAKHALGMVHRIEAEGDKTQKEYVSYVCSFPYMILNNGLGQACAFFLANKKTTHKDVYLALEAWLTKDGRPYHNCGGLMAGITDSDRATYLLAQAEALAYLEWLKKFAKAFLAEPDGTEEKS